MPNRTIHYIRLILLFFLLSLLNSAFSQDGLSRECESKYFTISYPSEVSLSALTHAIDVYPSQYLIFDSHSYNLNPELSLAKIIDALFLEASDILDMHLYSFHAKIKIMRNPEELGKVFYRYFKKELKAPSFYIPNSNTIYLEAASLNAYILGHEMAHAIISHYFVVLPPEKIQEVLAGYVEYQLKKK